MKAQSTFNETHLINAFGPEATVRLAVLNGYAHKVGNPHYDPTIPEKIIDPSWVEPENFDPIADVPPLIDNVLYTDEVSQELINNPESPLEFLNRRKDEIGLYGLYEKYRQYVKEEFGNTGLADVDAKFKILLSLVEREIIE